MASCLMAGCGASETPGGKGHRLQVVATTAVLADLASRVAGPDVDVTSLVPKGADPHSYEPSLRDIRKVAYADVAFSNYLMLEQHSVIKTLDANLRPGVPNISLAEASTKYGAEVIPLVENANLDTIWLGLRVAGQGKALGADRSSEVEIQATGLEGPGSLAAYITETFGRPKVFTDSGDGFDEGSGYAHDTTTLPVDAHTHMSWAFGAPGVYRLHLRAVLRAAPGAEPRELGTGSVRFVVGTNPDEATLDGKPVVGQRLEAGHADITVDLDQRPGAEAMKFQLDAAGTAQPKRLGLDEAVVIVPARAMTEVPASPEFRFLGRPGTQIHQLPQAVLGAHVHGEIDPHLWLSVNNAKAYVRTIADTLAHADPDHAAAHRSRAAEVLRSLSKLDADVARTVSTIPASRRHLVTTHDAYGYFAKAYGFQIAGFVTPNPGVEPSLPQRRKLSQTIRQLKVPAVFLEPTLVGRSAVLRTLADEAGVQVCPIWADSFTPDVTSYEQMMRANADSLARCLAPAPVNTPDKKDR